MPANSKIIFTFDVTHTVVVSATRPSPLRALRHYYNEGIETVADRLRQSQGFSTLGRDIGPLCSWFVARGEGTTIRRRAQEGWRKGCPPLPSPPPEAST